MVALLVHEWLAGAEPIAVIDEASVAVVRERVRREGAALGFPEATLARIVNVASELGHNQIAHAPGGLVAVRIIEREGTPGIEIVAADHGPGLVDPTRALKGEPRPIATSPDARSSLGVGLAASLELADEIDFDVRMGEGTCIWARKFAKPVPRRRQVGIYGRPCPGERESGDHGGFIRADDMLLVALVDGLGHGEPAREASNAAMEIVRASPTLSLDSILAKCHEALEDTRGGVMTLARIDEPGAVVQTGAVGNVTLQVYGMSNRWSATAPSFVLGARGQRLRPSTQEHAFGLRDVVVLFTDGVSIRADLEGQFELLREHPVVIAHHLVSQFARDNDDALAIVIA